MRRNSAGADPTTLIYFFLAPLLFYPKSVLIERWWPKEMAMAAPSRVPSSVHAFTRE